MSKKYRGPKSSTMKCIKLLDGSIERVRYEEADVMVTSQRATFVPKKDWKVAGRPQKERAPVEQSEWI